MILLKDILYGVRLKEVKGGTNVAIDGVYFDSRKVSGFAIYVAIKGTVSDGHDFIEQAIAAGAVAVVCEEMPDHVHEGVTYVLVQDSAAALSIIAANVYDNPSEKLKLVGVTGTNGKTTTVTLLYNLFRLMGYKVGMLSTVVNKIGNEEVQATHTTPDAVQLNAMLAKMVEKGCTHCFMEVSSHAVDQKRIHGLKFEVAVFSNISRDHLDYHKTFNAYIKAKKAFFDTLPFTSTALVNKDDTHGETMVQDTRATVKTFALKSMADYKARILENTFEGLQLQVDGQEVWSKMVGNFNAYNILTVYAVAHILGEEQVDVLTTISTLNTVSGRFERIQGMNKITAVIDYAHTPDALQNVIQTINAIRTGNEKLITVVGCGGDRDKGKRPLMAAIATELSDKVIFTSDNPRTESPGAIIEDMQAGVEGHNYKKVLSITDRAEAIKTACTLAEEGDVVLVAGKGHENYQEINGEKLPFDDKEHIQETLKLLEK